MNYKNISLEQAHQLIQNEEVNIVDIRDPASFMAGSIPNAINVSDYNVEEFVSTTDKSKPLLVLCYHGNSSKNAAEYFYSRGFTHSYSINGGYEAWKNF